MTKGLMKLVLVILVQLNFCLPAYGTGNTFYLKQLNALEAIHTNWTLNGPRPEGYLPGWGSWPEPCFAEDAGKNWLGVECLRLPRNTSYTGNNSLAEDNIIRVVGLTLRDASISGTLSAAIGDLSPLLFLTLTGNLDLTGPIPEDLESLYDSLITLDLSNNSLTGRFPNLSNSPSLQTLNLSNNHLEGNLVLDAFDNLTSLTTIDLSNNRFSGTFPRLRTVPWTTSTGLSMIKHINLSRNAFFVESLNDLGDITFNKGYGGDVNSSVLRVLDLSHNNISGNVSNLDYMMLGIGSQVQEVYLDNNNISGIIGYNIVEFLSSGNYPLLRILSLTNNSIEGVASDILFHAYYKRTNLLSTIRLDGNPFCNRKVDNNSYDGFAVRCFCQQECYGLSFEKKVKSAAIKIALGISVPSLALMTLVAALLYHKSTRQHKYDLLQMQQRFEEYDVKPTIFTYRELEIATRNFHPNMKLGEGSYGAVYKGELSKSNSVRVGELSKSNIVAIKTVKQLHVNSEQGMDEFLNEVALISGMKHRNLVKLKGCCLRDKQRFLVYEYVENHDLEWNLLEGKSTEILRWSQRFRICLGVAHGLHYLHSLAQPKIIHRDIKAANILLDNNFEPKIADFGLALLFPEETTHIMTVHVAGTKGYLAPEYATLGQLSEKADVYSFGVVCLELVSGRRNVDNKMEPEQAVLTNWALKLHRQGKAFDILDPSLDSLSENELVEVNRVILTALLCLQYSEALRPRMASVVSMLQGDLHADVVDFETADAPLGFDDSRSFEVQQPGLGTIMEDHSIRLFKGQSCSTASDLYQRQRSRRHGMV